MDYYRDYYKLIPGRELKGDEVVDYLRNLWKKGVNPIEFMLVCDYISAHRDLYGLSEEHILYVSDILAAYRKTLDKLLLGKDCRSIKRELVRDVSKAVFGGVSDIKYEYNWRVQFSRGPIRNVARIIKEAMRINAPIEVSLILIVSDFDRMLSVFRRLRCLISLYKFKTDPKLRRKIRAKLKKLEKLKPEKRNTELEKFRRELVKEVVGE